LQISVYHIFSFLDFDLIDKLFCMIMAENNDCKRQKLSYRDALEHFKSHGKSFKGTADWVVDKSEIHADDGKENQGNYPENKVMAAAVIKTRIAHKWEKEQKKRKVLSAEELDVPIISKSVENILKPKVVAPSTSKKAGRPLGSFGNIKPDTERKKIQPIVKAMEKVASEFGISVTQLCGCIIEQVNSMIRQTISDTNIYNN
jgi:hypothetical protein